MKKIFIVCSIGFVLLLSGCVGTSAKIQSKSIGETSKYHYEIKKNSAIQLTFTEYIGGKKSSLKPYLIKSPSEGTFSMKYNTEKNKANIILENEKTKKTEEIVASYKGSMTNLIQSSSMFFVNEYELDEEKLVSYIAVPKNGNVKKIDQGLLDNIDNYSEFLQEFDYLLIVKVRQTSI